MQPLHILQVVQTLDHGGLEKVVLHLVNHSGPEFRFTVCCLEHGGEWADQVATDRGRVVALHKSPGLSWRTAWRVARLARTERVDLVHTHNAAAHLYGALGGWLARVPVLHTEHHPKLGNEERRINRVNHFAARFTNRTVAVSRKLADIAEAYEGVRHCGVVYNGIPLERFDGATDRAALRSELGLPVTARLIGSVGRLAEQKNFPLLLRAFQKLAADSADSYLVIAGDGPLRVQLAGEISRLDLRSRAFLLGARPDIPQLLGSLDVFALASHNEGHPVAVLEAMAAGCPIVVTAVPGNVEAIQNGVTGLIVPPDDPPALIHAMKVLLANPAKAREYAHAARADARARFSVQEMVRQYEELWRQLAGVRQPTLGDSAP